MSLIALDLDNTTANFTDGLARYLTLSPDFAERVLPEHSSYDLVRAGWFKDSNTFAKHFTEAEASGLYLSLFPFVGAIDALHRLRNDGHRIIVVTARSASYYGDTLRWLTTYGIRFERLIHTDSKASVQADLFIDDADYQIASLLRAGKRVLAHDRAYNRHLDVPRFNSWADVPALVTSLSARASLQ